MNDTEWYLVGGLIAAGVVILILLFLLFRRRQATNGVIVETDSEGKITEEGAKQLNALQSEYLSQLQSVDYSGVSDILDKPIPY